MASIKDPYTWWIDQLDLTTDQPKEKALELANNKLKLLDDRQLMLLKRAVQLESDIRECQRAAPKGKERFVKHG